jgi:hypothetical protein
MVGQSLAFRAHHRFLGAFGILDAEFRAVVVTEVELSGGSGPEGEVTIHINDKELSLAEFGRMLTVHA